MEDIKLPQSLRDWLPDFVKKIEYLERVNEQFNRIMNLPGYFCCYCGVKTLVNVHLESYVTKYKTPPACKDCAELQGLTITPY